MAPQPGRRVAAVCVAAWLELMLIGGQPIREPVEQYGPFVMNTREEVEQAVRDYQRGVLTE